MKATRVSIRAAGALFALLALLLFVAAACSDDSDDPGPTATEPAVEEPTATERAAADPTATEPAAADPTATEPAAPETTVNVSLTEFVVGPSTDTASVGTLTFNITSDGAIFHNLRVIATDLAPDALPTDDATLSVDEEQLDVVASTDDLDPDEQETLTVELAAGSYVLICNIPGHYESGMTTAFSVQ